MNKEEKLKKLTCQICNEVLSQAVLLDCCGATACKQHMDKLIVNGTYKCPYCEKAQEIDSIRCIAKEVEKELAEMQLDSKDLSKMESLKAQIAELSSIIVDPDTVINDKIQDLKLQVDLDREIYKCEIDR